MTRRGWWESCVFVLSIAGCGDVVDPDQMASSEGGSGAGDGTSVAEGAAETGATTSGGDATGGGEIGTPDPQPEPTRIVLLIPGTAIVGSYFDDMAAKLEEDGFEPIIYETPDLLTESLAIGAVRISDKIDEVLAASGDAKVHIVAECNGGVATRYALQVLGGSERVDQFVSFVSAHHGTWLSPVGDWTTGFDSLADITPGSPFLTQLNAAPFPQGLEMTSIYSCNDELMLPYDTSVVDGATNVLFCDHYLGHLDGFWDPVVYERIHASLGGQGAQAPTHY
jgi:triacylglycerol lipase